MSKNVRIMYKARIYVSIHNMKSLYFSIMHSYINYANITWGSTTETKQQIHFKYQKQVSCLIHFKTPSTELMKKLNILNIHQLNLFQVLIFTYQHKQGTLPIIFRQHFSQINYEYPTRNSKTL